MSRRYKGAVLSATPPTTSTSSASGVWTEQQFMQGVASGSWPALAGAPTIGTATAGALSASVAFTAPAYVGSGITGYTATSSPGGFTGTGASSPVTVSGLTAGTAYTFTVTATTAAGQGPASAASNSVTPTAPNYIEDVFSTYLYTGNATARSITNNIDLSTKGGLTWIKERSAALDNILFDTNRGAGYQLYSNLTNGQSALKVNSLSSFNSNGFSLGTDAGNDGVNRNNQTYASWTFAKQAKFFDVVTYTGNGSTQNIAHNLGSEPGCIIVKKTSGAASWYVYHRSLGDSAYINLNLNDPAATGQYSYFYGGPSSTTFTVNAASGVNESGQTFVAYIYAHNAGGFGLTGTDNVVSCASYTGNGSANGPVINLGYEPQFVIIKQSSAGSNDWYMYDNMRGVATGGNDAQLSPNLNVVEQTTSDILSFTATGFQLTNIYSNTNGSGATYIYIAIRRGPMAVPTVGTTVYNGVARTGTGATATITAGFPVDLIIAGVRNRAYGAKLWDRLRGITNPYLNPATTGAEYYGATDAITAGTQTGITVGADTSDWVINKSGDTYIDWFFQRAPSFFDEVCYVGNYTGGADPLITHNLGVVPELIIQKSRNSTSLDWYVNGFSTPGKFLFLNLTSAIINFGAWDAATSTGFKSVFASSNNCVAYLFATCAGVSKVGSYTGNGTTQTINCGFTGGARFVLIKRTDSTGDWYVYDTARGMTTLTDPYYRLNDTTAETATLGSVTTVSTGFALDSAILAAINVNGGSYIFLAIA